MKRDYEVVSSEVGTKDDPHVVELHATCVDGNGMTFWALKEKGTL